MYLRIFSAALLPGTLAACGSGSESPQPEGDAIECAIGAGSDFSPVCILEPVSQSEFIVHHPDGGFRRFTKDDVITPSDGAHALSAAPFVDGIVEIEVDGDRYRIPDQTGA